MNHESVPGANNYKRRVNKTELRSLMGDLPFHKEGTLAAAKSGWKECTQAMAEVRSEDRSTAVISVSSASELLDWHTSD